MRALPPREPETELPPARQQPRVEGFRRPALGTFALAVLLGACGGSGRHFDGTVFRNDELAFRVERPPPSWRPIDVDQALLSFRDDSAQATIAVNGRCHVDGDDVPLTALTHHLFLQFSDREILEQRRLELAGREALRTELLAELDGVPRRFTVYVLKKDWCVYDFIHIGPTSNHAASQSRFDQFVTSFRTLEAS